MRNNNIDISVIMPAYNADKYISEAIDGIISQKFSGSYELLIADDVSSDNTALIIKQYQSKYPQLIKVYSNGQNLGCSDNSISLCTRAKGKYLAFCDADDVWVSPHKLQCQFDFLELHQEYGMCVTQSVGNKQVRCVRGGVDFIQLIKGHTDVYNSSIVMRRELYEKMLVECKWFVKNKCFFDTVWSYWFAKHSQIYSMPEQMMYYRERKESDCRTEDSQKRYNLDKRYYNIKTAFLLQNNVKMEYVMDVLQGEYDYLFDVANWMGEQKVRNTKAYKIGKKITSIFGWIKLLN